MAPMEETLAPSTVTGEEEETASNYEYPEEYKGPKLIDDQNRTIAKIFDLDPAMALEYSKNLPSLPEGAEGWFAFPSLDAIVRKNFPEMTDLAEKYCCAVRLILGKIGESRDFYNYRAEQIDPAHLRMHVRTAEFLEKISEVQDGSDILVIAAQLGMRHRGRSTRRSRELFIPNEFGLSSLITGSIILVHPERLVRLKELDIDCAGDEFAPDAGGGFSHAPYFIFNDDQAKFGTSEVGSYYGNYGSASGFLPQ